MQTSRVLLSRLNLISMLIIIIAEGSMLYFCPSITDELKSIV